MPDVTATSNVIDAVVERHLCCGCGTCVAACPVGALSLCETVAGYVWACESGRSACVGCGRCLSVCPGSHLKAAALPPSEDPFVGRVRSAYWAWAVDPDVCFRGTSGGVATALLCALLEAGTIEAALVTRWKPGWPLRPEPFLARKGEEVRCAQKSKYCAVPLNSVIREIEKLDGPVAIVGLPCHLHGLANLSEFYPPVIQNVALRIGLFCDRILSYRVMDRLLATGRVPPSETEAFEYRHKGVHGWPGDVYIKRKGKPATFLDREERIRLKESFTPVRCRLCFDKFNVLADISVGDGYGGPQRREGVSAVLARTEAGEQALATASTRLELHETSSETVLRHQNYQGRKESVSAYTAAFQQWRPGVEPPLPEACRSLVPAVKGRQLSRYLRRLRSDAKLESLQSPVLAKVVTGFRLSRASLGMAFRKLARSGSRRVARLLRGLTLSSMRRD